jgi:long-chain acyl-CoA synthetase
MRKVGSSHPGDVITLDFHADNVSIAMNGNNLGTLAAPRFGRALLSIWLGERPVESGLKKALLGS